MFYEPKDGHGLPRGPLNACVAPRPIGWISTLAADGTPNLAPFSYSNLVGSAPPMFVFSSNGHHVEGEEKDSALNAKATGEFVYNHVTWELREAMNESSAGVQRNVDEFELAGLTKAPSRLVKPPRVAEAPIHLECRTWQVIELPSTVAENRNRLVIGEVVGVHIADEVLTEGFVDIAKVRPVARLGYMDYCVVDEVFEMLRPR